jgi:hypothetical protein
VAETILLKHTVPIQRELPVWPVVLLFVGLPAWYVLGLGGLIWQLMAIPMGLALMIRGRSKLPPGFAIWALFLALMIFSVIQIDTPGRLVGFGYRATLYLSATVLLIYVYNLSVKRFTLHHGALVLTGFWLGMVVLGYAAVLRPEMSFSTPLGMLVPGGLRSNEIIGELFFPQLSQYDPEGWVALPRPAAPFPYTNNWGSNYSLLLPFVFIAISGMRTYRAKIALTIAVVLSLVPAFLTLNRGMFLCLGLLVAYVSIRLLGRGHVGPLIAMLGMTVVAVGVIQMLPVSERLNERIETSDTNETRLTVYDEAFARSLESPILGYGAPRPSEVIDGGPAVGTQGQIWTVLFSHGFPAAILFASWFIWAFLRTVRAPTTNQLLVHAVLLLVPVQIIFYGVMIHNLHVAMIAIALGLRAATADRSDRDRQVAATITSGPTVPREADRMAPR